MNLDVSDRAAEAINELVASGRFADPGQAVEAAAIALLSQSLIDDTWVSDHRAAIDEGLAAIDRGDVVDGTPEMYESLRDRIRGRSVTRD